jgi:hypothetical protein
MIGYKDSIILKKGDYESLLSTYKLIQSCHLLLNKKTTQVK